MKKKKLLIASGVALFLALIVFAQGKKEEPAQKPVQMSQSGRFVMVFGNTVAQDQTGLVPDFETTS